VLKYTKLKFHSLTGRITIKLMRQAFKSVKKNRGRAGIDCVYCNVSAQSQTKLDRSIVIKPCERF